MWGIPTYGRHLSLCPSPHSPWRAMRVYTVPSFPPTHTFHTFPIWCIKAYMWKSLKLRKCILFCARNTHVVTQNIGWIILGRSQSAHFDCSKFTQEKSGKALPCFRADQIKQNILANCINCFLYY